MIYLVLNLFSLMSIPSGYPTQKEIDVGGMELTYSWHEDQLIFTIDVPTTGWAGVGFNTKNDIAHADLLLFHIVDDKPEARDMYVVKPGQPQDDQKLGGTCNVNILESWEKDGETHIVFSIPAKSRDPYDFQHTPDKELWLILAYSNHDDFGHHSRMRRHVPFSFSK